MAIDLRWRITIPGAITVLALFALLAGVSVATWEYTNSDAFCSNACHAVHPEETYAHHASQHASLQCVECHVGRLSTVKAAAVKATHIRHAWALMVGYERPLTAPSMPASRDSCEGCHSAEPHRNNAVRVRRHFAPDEANTEAKVALILRTAGRQVVDDASRGIHWHTPNRVRYVAADPQRENITWIESMRPDGGVVTYTDVTAPPADDEIARAEKCIMECTDCHNETGHPFRNPVDLVEEALTDDPVIRRLPYVKARVTELLNQDFEPDEQALALTEQAWKKYKLRLPREDWPNLQLSARKAAAAGRDMGSAGREGGDRRRWG